MLSIISIDHLQGNFFSFLFVLSHFGEKSILFEGFIIGGVTLGGLGGYFV